MTGDELAHRRASELNTGPVQATSLFVGIYVPQRHRADGTEQS
jgi:hypothetical protein